MKDFTESYLTEAFRKLSLLEADFDFTSQDVGKADELKSFVADDIDAPDEEEIIDVEAEKDDELQDSYVGKVIIECDCCHTRLYKNQEDIHIDEETGLANVDEECPVCNGTFGYKVIGKIEEFDDTASFEEPEEDILLDSEGNEIPAEDDADIEVGADDVDFTDDEFKEALNNVVKKDTENLEHTNLEEGCHMNEDDVCPKCGKNPCVCEKEEVDEELLDHGNDNFGLSDYVAVDDDKSLEDDQKDLVQAAEENAPAINEGVQIDMNSHVVSSDSPDINVDVNNGEVQITDGFGGEAQGEMIAPLEPEQASEIEAQIAPAEDSVDDAADIDALEGDSADAPIDDLGAEADANVEDDIGLEGEPEEKPVEEEPIDGEEETGEEPEVEEESFDGLDDFDENSFNDMGESYLRKVYDNVKSFVTEDINIDENKNLVVEGKITFESGKERKTKFVFENMSTTKRGKTLLEGHNDMFSKSNKSFLLKGSLVDKKFIGESLVYNYTASTINESNEAETVKVCGRVRAR